MPPVVLLTGAGAGDNTPRIAHRSGRCDCMSSPSPFSPTQRRAYDVYLRMRVLDAGIPA
jgi:hypothetical protein